ncbi:MULTISPECIES: ParM/StbA family protein [Eubacteriales]|uniref:ParM/StbA family protein n=1 Tax=Eubacteriales TaxID=186802 RepID=UPI001F445260|nr:MULTISPECIES: ParM/StbA family protein [Eubacteriales]MCF6466624.1 ATPase [Clostridium sp. Cult2]WIV12806.1 ParM/StbA family protein [Proteiniborus sp. MB09-C3]
MSSNIMLIGLDNGNKCTKNHVGFVCESGFTKSDVEPITKSNLLVYKGDFYTIGSSRLSVQTDKTINDNTFILSLPAIADEIYKQGIQGEIKGFLGVGLPIVHYGKMKHKFREYFIRDNIKFSFNGSDYAINIVDCRVYPQGYAAFINIYKDYKNVSAANVIDIGGYTTDFFIVENGIINTASCYSLPNGVITLFGSIQQELLKMNINLTEKQIQDIILGREPVLFDADIGKMIEMKAEEYVENLLTKILEYGFEFRNPTIIVGGGGMMLRKYIESSDKIKYIENLDQFANAKGYKILLEQELRR